MRSANHGDRTKANWLDPMIRVSDLILDAQDARVDFTEVDACNGFGPGALLGGHIFLNGPREAGLMRDSVPLLASIEVSGRLTRSPDLHQAPVFRGFCIWRSHPGRLARQCRRSRADQEVAPTNSSTQAMKARSLTSARRLGWKATCNGIGSSCQSVNNGINLPSAVQGSAM